MNFERKRLQTFMYFPYEYIDIKLLAKWGFYYSGQQELCRCYFCNIEVNTWNAYTSPFLEHWKLSSTCPLLTNNFTNNIPIKLV